MKPKQNRHLYEFDDFSLNVTEKIFLRNQELIPLTPKAFDTLLFLVQKNGQLIEKDELIHAIWPDSFVAENSLTQNIHQLRRAMGEKSDGSSYIETVPRRGYRFNAEVCEIKEPEPEPEIVYRSGNNINARFLLGEDLIHNAETIEDDTLEPEQDFAQEHDNDAAKDFEEKKTLRLPESKSFLTKRNIAGFFLLLAIVVLAISLWQWRTNRATGYQPKSIAILPFKPLLQNESDQRLGIGMADALIMKLSNQQRLQVKPTSAIIKYAGHESNPIDVGHQLEVDAIIDGTLQREDARVRVSVQVIDVKTEKPIWSGKFDELYTDIFAVQDAISERVSDAITLQLNASEKEHLWKRYTNNTEAYQAYATGIYFWNKRTKEDLAKAVEYLQQAIEKDPNYALAYAALADCYYLQGYYGYVDRKSEETGQMVEAEANKALAIDPNLAEAHVAIAGIKISFRRDMKGAEESYRRAITLNPNYATAHLRYAWLLHATGRWQDALPEMKKAQELDPLSVTNNSALGSLLMMLRQYDDAVKYCRRAVELDSKTSLARSNLAAALTRKGLHDEAISELQKLEAEKRDDMDLKQEFAITYAFAGRHDEARKYLDKILKEEMKPNTLYYNAGIIYGLLGDKDKAFELMNNMKAPAPYIAVLLRNDPDVDSLRNDPRFGELLKKYTPDFEQRSTSTSK